MATRCSFQRTARETNLKENGYWLYVLNDAFEKGYDPKNILSYAEFTQSISPSLIKDAANRYLNIGNYAHFTLLPETSSAMPVSKQ